MTYADKLRKIVSLLDLTQEELADRLDSSQSSVNRWIAGKGDPGGRSAERINALYNEIIDGGVINQVPLIGIVGAGQAVYPINDGANDMVEAPENASKTTVAVKVTGDSMMPWLEDGWLIYYSKQLPPDEMVNRRCIIQLSDERLMVKTLLRGSQAGLWTLISTNAAPIEDVAVRWVAPIDWIKPQY